MKLSIDFKKLFIFAFLSLFLIASFIYISFYIVNKIHHLEIKLSNQNFDNNILADYVMNYCKNNFIKQFEISTCSKNKLSENIYSIYLILETPISAKKNRRYSVSNMPPIIKSKVNLLYKKINEQIKKQHIKYLEYDKIFFDKKISNVNSEKKFMLLIKFNLEKVGGKDIYISQFYKTNFNRTSILINYKGILEIHQYRGGSSKPEDGGFIVKSSIQLKKNQNIVGILFDLDKTLDEDSINFYVNGNLDNNIQTNSKNNNIINNTFYKNNNYFSIGTEFHKNNFLNTHYKEYRIINVEEFYVFDNYFLNAFNINNKTLASVSQLKIPMTDKKNYVSGFFINNKDNNLKNPFNLEVYNLNEINVKFLKYNTYSEISLESKILPNDRKMTLYKSAYIILLLLFVSFPLFVKRKVVTV